MEGNTLGTPLRRRVEQSLCTAQQSGKWRWCCDIEQRRRLSERKCFRTSCIPGSEAALAIHVVPRVLEAAEREGSEPREWVKRLDCRSGVQSAVLERDRDAVSQMETYQDISRVAESTVRPTPRAYRPSLACWRATRQAASTLCPAHVPARAAPSMSGTFSHLLTALRVAALTVLSIPVLRSRASAVAFIGVIIRDNAFISVFIHVHLIA